ncbi:MAG: SDR family NAD(P)-dependent oxidoreductase, partial [Verrucomicrobia bacterium]|nr:SDR family NAD(P)-dependent oxidoreductase [Verrucomicrobiota bacterium]
RGRLMEAQPAGAMLAVSLPEAEVRPLLGPELAVAAINAPQQTVVSGPAAGVAKLAEACTTRGVAAVRLPTSHAYHSPMMEPAACEFAVEFRGVSPRPPQWRWVSNVTGTWIADEQARDPAYWARQLCETVRFADGVGTLLADPAAVFLEVGPGRTLTTLAAQQPGWTPQTQAVTSLRHPREARGDDATLLHAAGRLWSGGVKLDWEKFFEEAARRRVPLPAYPFEGERHWIESAVPVAAAAVSGKKPDLADWFYVSSWRRAPAPAAAAAGSDGAWLVLADRGGLAAKVVARLEARGATVHLTAVGEDGAARFAQLAREGRPPRRLVSLRDVAPADAPRPDGAGFSGLLALAKALGGAALPPDCRLTVVANGLHAFAGEQVLQPDQALLHGPARVLPKEVPGLATRVVDVVWPPADSGALADALIAEAGGGDEAFVALRGRDRWAQSVEAVRLDSLQPRRVRERGVYLVTGGLGGIGLVLAEDLARRVQARLVLVGRSAPGPETVQRLDALRAAGAEVMVAAADVTDAAAMRQVLATARERFGAIHGVIHAAGLPGGGVMALRTDKESAA